jgi:lysophosphatidic acid acyltransferase/lysophosphatidylinositol acyltransferase
VFYGDIDLLKTKYTGNKLLLSNHIAATDGVALFALAHRVRRLGQLRFFAKKSLLFFPVLGLGCYFLNFVFLSRNWLKDSKKIRETFADMMQWKRFWMCLFPEGTRITVKKLRESQEFALERNMRPLQHVLQPRVKGLCAALAALRSEVRRRDPSAIVSSDAAAQVDGVVDVTIGYAGRDLATGRAEPSIAKLLLSRPAAPQPLHVHVRVVPAGELPDGGDATAVGAWISDVFEEKVPPSAIHPANPPHPTHAVATG